MRLFRYLASLWDNYRGNGGRVVGNGSGRLVAPSRAKFQYAPPSDEPVRGEAANAVVIDEQQDTAAAVDRVRRLADDVLTDRSILTTDGKAVRDATLDRTRPPQDSTVCVGGDPPKPTGPSFYGPGHPDWKGRAEIPLVESGWALPGHPLFIYQQFLKYQQDANGLPAGWKVIGWTPEGVSYIVPEPHWTEQERKSPHVTIRHTHSPFATPDEIYREKLKATPAGLMSDAEIDERVRQYRNYTTQLNEKAAEVLDTVRAGAERHARILLDNNPELAETFDNMGPAKVVERKIEEWVKECGQRAVDKRLSDSVRLLNENSLLKAIPVDNFIYAPPKVE